MADNTDDRKKKHGKEDIDNKEEKQEEPLPSTGTYRSAKEEEQERKDE